MCGNGIVTNDNPGHPVKPGSHSRQKLDLTGQRFGKLVVTGPAENIGGRTAWHCKCDCGNEKIVKTCHLRTGHVKSCGCGGIGSRKHALGLTYVDGTCVEMLAANTRRRNNRSGVVGVEWYAAKKRWRASICFKGQRRHLGDFKTFDEAVVARKAAEKELVEPFLAQYGRAKVAEDLRQDG